MALGLGVLIAASARAGHGLTAPAAASSAPVGGSVSTRNDSHCQSAAVRIAAADLELTATDLNEIETASAAITVQGARYPEAMERLIDR
jgi:hypothetical protein